MMVSCTSYSACHLFLLWSQMRKGIQDETRARRVEVADSEPMRPSGEKNGGCQRKCQRQVQSRLQQALPVLSCFRGVLLALPGTRVQ